MKRLAFIFFISVLIASCGHKDNGKLSPSLIENPASAGGNNKNVKVPKFEFEEPRHDFGEVKEGDVLKFSFKFKNVGEGDLIISDVGTTCGCTVASYSKTPVHEGGSGQIDVVFNTSQKSGEQTKTVTVIANTIPATKVLIINAEVIPGK